MERRGFLGSLIGGLTSAAVGRAPTEPRYISIHPSRVTPLISRTLLPHEIVDMGRINGGIIQAFDCLENPSIESTSRYRSPEPPYGSGSWFFA